MYLMCKGFVFPSSQSYVKVLKLEDSFVFVSHGLTGEQDPVRTAPGHLSGMTCTGVPHVPLRLG